jgi:enoyl-CoA hydratase
VSQSTDIHIRIEGKAGRITLARPAALNALTYEMCLAIDAALITWAETPAVEMLILDAEGDKAFCSGGDIAEMYATGTAGDYSYGRKFWADEYRMNARMFDFPKPVASFLQGFTMGGGVGVGCHGSHRVVCETSQIAMPEVGIGLVPDVGGSLILARAPGRVGEYLGTTATRMGPGDAIFAGFADYYIPREAWGPLIETLCETGDWDEIDRSALPAPDSPLAALQPEIDAAFAGSTLRDILNLLHQTDGDFATETLKKLGRGAPLSVASAVELVHRARTRDDIRHALTQEYRFTARSMEKGDFLEGIRAAIIDKDKSPKWRHDALDAVGVADVSAMLLPLGADELKF